MIKLDDKVMTRWLTLHVRVYFDDTAAGRWWVGNVTMITGDQLTLDCVYNTNVSQVEFVSRRV